MFPLQCISYIFYFFPPFICVFFLCKLGLELDTYVNYISDNCAWTLYFLVHYFMVNLVSFFLFRSDKTLQDVVYKLVPGLFMGK